jgi:uncharacterized protein YneF (UPF0154 family)
MSTTTPAQSGTGFIDKQWLREKLFEIDARHGVKTDPSLTARKVREMMLADGIRPEENEFSREIMRMRYEEQP